MVRSLFSPVSADPVVVVRSLSHFRAADYCRYCTSVFVRRATTSSAALVMVVLHACKDISGRLGVLMADTRSKFKSDMQFQVAASSFVFV